MILIQQTASLLQLDQKISAKSAQKNRAIETEKRQVARSSEAMEREREKKTASEAIEPARGY